MNQHSEIKTATFLTSQNNACHDGGFFSCLDDFCFSESRIRSITG